MFEYKKLKAEKQAHLHTAASGWIANFCVLHASISLSLLAQHHLASFIITGCSEGGKYKSIEMLRRAEGAVGVCFCLLLCDIKQPLFEEGVRGCFSTALTTVSMDRAALQTPRSCDPGQITCDFKKVH